MERQDAKMPSRQEPAKEVDEWAHRVIGAAIEVHRHLGPGYPESIYEEALCHELQLRGIPFERQPRINVNFKGHHVGRGTMDIWVARCLVVELKAVETVLPRHLAQGNAYLKATCNELALVINFNVAVLKDGVHRVVLTSSSR